MHNAATNKKNYIKDSAHEFQLEYMLFKTGVFTQKTQLIWLHINILDSAYFMLFK